VLNSPEMLEVREWKGEMRRNQKMFAGRHL
jgi:hypothetical protein